MWKWTLLIALVLLADDARAQTLDIQAGRLMGAYGVQVNGTFYDVAFMDGTCVGLFDGCDDPTDFVTNDFVGSIAFAQAIELILNNEPLDTEPELTNGCANDEVCYIYTPIHKHGADPSLVGVRQALNLRSFGSESVYPFEFVDEAEMFVSHIHSGPEDPLRFRRHVRSLVALSAP
jgi:hypothetical protein